MKEATLLAQSTSIHGMPWNHSSLTPPNKAKQSSYSIANTVPIAHQDCFLLYKPNLINSALHLRNRDRHLNMHQYPKLHYPEIYILQGGYSGFFTHHKERCEPQNYVAMQDERHKATCAREMRNFGKNTKLIRTQSFTYGITATTASTNGFGMMSVAATGMMEQEEDETMNTEDDTFEGIESRLTMASGGMMSSGHRRVPSSKSIFTTRRAVSY
jgi:hypothetical protein